jgi:hypothetical protein
MTSRGRSIGRLYNPDASPEVRMSYRLVFVVVALVVFAASPAQAKAPPNGLTFCGAGDACVSMTFVEAEALQLWTPTGERPPAAPAPYYALHVIWQPGGAEQMFYWIPSRGLVRRQYDWGGVGWLRVPDQQLPPSVADITPIAVPDVTAATVDGRRVRSPATYLRLLSVGHVVSVSPVIDWLRVRFTATAPSPFTDANTDVRIAKRGAYLLRDRFVFKIPDRLADRARRGLPLNG